MFLPAASLCTEDPSGQAAAYSLPTFKSRFSVCFRGSYLDSKMHMLTLTA